MVTVFPLIADHKPPTGISIDRTQQQGVYIVFWTAPQGSKADEYKIEYKDVDEDLGPITILTGSAAPRYTLDLRSNEPGGRYIVRVQAICGGQAGKWSRYISIFNGKRSKLTCTSFY